MKDHLFFFKPGHWVGKGTISLTLSNDALNYETHWKVQPEKDGTIICTQSVQIEGSGEQVINELHFSQIKPDSFEVQLNNVMIGNVPGKGLLDDKVIAWEYKNNTMGFEGFEVYEKRSESCYGVRGEYASDDQTRTKILGEIHLVEDSKS